MTTILNALGHSNSTCSVSTDGPCQYPIYLPCSPNNPEINVNTKRDGFSVEILDDGSTPRFSPSSLKTPIKDGSSPGSLELPSMPSEKSNSRGCSDGRPSSGFFMSSDLTDTDRSNSANSLSPIANQVEGRSGDRSNYVSVHRVDDLNTDCHYERQGLHDPSIKDSTKLTTVINPTYTSFLPNAKSQAIYPSQSQFAFIPSSSYQTSSNANIHLEYPRTWRKPTAQSMYSHNYDTQYQSNCFSPQYNQQNPQSHITPNYPYPSTIPDYHRRYQDGSNRNYNTAPSNHHNYAWHQYENRFYKYNNLIPAAYSTPIPENPVIQRNVSRPCVSYREAPINHLSSGHASANYATEFQMRNSSFDSGYMTSTTSFCDTSNAFKNLSTDLPSDFESPVLPSTAQEDSVSSVNDCNPNSQFVRVFSHDSDSPSHPKTYDKFNEVSPLNPKRQVNQKRCASQSKTSRNLKHTFVDPGEKKVDIMSVKCKRKANKMSPHLGEKRRRTSDPLTNQDTSANSAKNTSSLESIVRSILPHNVSRFVQDPVISTALHLYPPSPSPWTFPPNSKIAYSDDNQSCSTDESFNNCGRKYYHFPLCLRKPPVKPVTDANIFRFVTNSSDLKGRFSKLVEENFLIDSYKRAISKNVCLSYFPPCTPTDRSSSTSCIPQLELSDSHSNLTTPPLVWIHKNDKPSPKTTTYNVTKTLYAEETIYSNQLPGRGLVACSRCLMQILTPEKALSCKLLDKETRIFFCSLSCAVEFKKNQSNHNYEFLVSNETNSSLPSMTFALTDSTQSLPILLQKNVLVKNSKTLLKRPAFFDNKYSRRRNGVESNGQNGIHLIHSSLFKRWHDIRWRRFSESPHVSSGSFHADKRSRPLVRRLKSSARNRFTNDIDIGFATRSLAKSDKLDTRICCLCQKPGDDKPEISGRLINVDLNRWTHVNCILWCYDTYETVSGSLVDVLLSLEKSSKALCTHCGKCGAGLPCFDPDCPSIYHLPCAHKINCLFYPDRSMFCPSHHANGVNCIPLDCLTVDRRVYVSRDENAQVANVILNEDYSNDTSPARTDFAKLRIGSLILNQIGQLLPEQLTSGLFHNSDYIYPVGYRSTRIYWSYRHLGRRCQYHCRIEDDSGHPASDESSSRSHPAVRFVIDVSEDGEVGETFEDTTCNGVWQKVLARINRLRHDSRSNRLRIFQEHIRGETLYGLSEPHIVRAIESLPGVDRLNNYTFKFGKLQLIKEMPLAVNPTGCARSEPKLRTYIRRKPAGEGCICPSVTSNHISLSSPNLLVPSSSDLGSPTHLASQSTTIMSKFQQYRRLHSEWKTNVILARSRIQGLGLYAARDLSKHTFIIEYLGEVIRNEVGNRRERLYESQNRGVYMFRVDDDWIVDATMCGGLARYINHSCDPNCTAEIMNCDNGSHIIIIANKNIEKGDELTYDYKFDVEEDRWDRIPCLCGSVNCRKWMN